MKTDKYSSLFPDAQDMYDRYRSLRENDPYKGKRDAYMKNYYRQAWRRDDAANCNKKDPNFGQFKSKIDAAIAVFTNVNTERRSAFRVNPKYPKPGENIKPFSDKITSAFHKYFIRPWDDRFIDETMAAFDMVFYGKAIEFWKHPGSLYSCNVPVERVFPDTNACLNPKKWSYFFIEVQFTIAELYEILENEQNEEYELHQFDKTYLAEILESPETYARTKSATELGKHEQGEHGTGGRDHIIDIVFAYVKDNFKEENKVSVYAFPAEMKNMDENTSEKIGVKTLIKKKGYCKCLSNCIAVRAFQLTRSYWRFNSFAQQIYLATMLYDKSMSLMIRAAKRNMILYFKSSNPDMQKKLLRQSDDEVQVVDPMVELVQTGTNNGVREIMEVTRQVMIDTENGQSLAQAPGSQNTKGYAITAQEATLRAQQTGDAESLSIKIMMNKDLAMYMEMYRRGVDLHTDEHAKKAFSLFKKELQLYNVPAEYYKYENIYLSVTGSTSGASYNRIQSAEKVLAALRVAPTNPGEAQAQRDLISAVVGIDNVESYIFEKNEVPPSVKKAGAENEDLDNPYVNPANVPVMPDDKHMEEIPVHMADYEQKMKFATGIFQKGMQHPNAVMKLILLTSARDLIKAQDNKGGHIQGHIKAVSTSKENVDYLGPMLGKFKEIQGVQDQLTEQIEKAIEETSGAMNQNDLHSEEVRHAKEMNTMKEQHAKTLNDIAVAKDIGKKQTADETRANKVEQQHEDAVQKLASKQAESELKITTEQQLANQKIQNEQAKQEKAEGAGGSSEVS